MTLGVAAATTVGVGCSSKATTTWESTESTGNVGLALSAAPGVTINTVDYSITGPNSFSKAGPIDVTDSTRISALIGGIPANSGYTIELSATASGASKSCNGRATFDVAAAATTDVTVHMQCRGAHTTGSVEVNGTLNVCPNIDELSILPDEVRVGHSVQLRSSASDEDSGPSALGYSWTSTSGTIADPSSANTTFTCTTAGTSTVTLNVTDGDCGDTVSAKISCTGAGAEAGAADAGTPDSAGIDAGVIDSSVADGGAADGSAADTGFADGGATDSATGDAGGGGPGADITGTWASELKTTGTLTVPAIGSQRADIDVVLRLYLTRSAGMVSTELDVCRLNAVVPNQLTVDFPASVLALTSAMATEPDFTATIGGPVPIPDFTILLGEDASGASVDQDHDGNPGVTVAATLLGSQLSTYVGLTIHATLSATLQNATTLGGMTSFTSSGQVFGATPIQLTGPIAVSPSSPTSPLTATRIAGNVPCSQVVAQFQ
jgi:hypothetical protein